MTVTRLGAVALLAISLVLAGCGAAGPLSSLLPTPSQDSSADTPEPTDAEKTFEEETEPTGTATPAPDNTPAGSAVEVDLSRLATGETPQGWVEVLSGDGACRMAVPSDWITGVLPGTATGTYGQSILANDGVTDFKAEIAHLKATYFGELNDSANEVLIEDDHLFLMRETVRGGASFVISLNAENTACGIIVAVDEVAAADYLPISTEMLYTLAENR